MECVTRGSELEWLEWSLPAPARNPKAHRLGGPLEEHEDVYNDVGHW
jgi:hypothetical protein